MPLYDYICHESGEVREVFHKMDESPEIISEAGHKMVKKVGEVATPGMDQWGRSRK